MWISLFTSFWRKKRSYYSLERLWAEAPHIEVPEMERIPLLTQPEEIDEDEMILGLVSANEEEQV